MDNLFCGKYMDFVKDLACSEKDGCCSLCDCSMDLTNELPEREGE